MTNPKTLGPLVAQWVERNLVHGEGDFFGRPFILDPWERDLFNRLYVFDERTGRRLVRNAVVGIAKGNGKTEIGAAVGLAELAGPVMPAWDSKTQRWVGVLRESPNIPVAAASFDQANLVFGAAATMVREGNLAPYVDVFDVRMDLKDTPGRMFRVAAQAGTNDGGRPTAFIADEVHEWVGGKERVHLVISNSLAKRADGFSFNISTAGSRDDSLLGELYGKGRRVGSGEVDDPSFLFLWYEPSKDYDLDKPGELRQAIREANPASFVDVERIAARWEIDRIPEHEFRRYHLNQWVQADVAWINVHRWDESAGHSSDLADLENRDVWLGVDLSATQDVTAMAVLATCESNPDAVDVMMVYWLPEEWMRVHSSSPLAAWAREGRVRLTPGNVVDFREVGRTIRTVADRCQVRDVGYDPWQSTMLMTELHEEGLPVSEVRQGPAVLTAPTKEFERLASAGLLHHGNDPVLRWMVQNVNLQINGDRWHPSKSKSAGKIDGVVAVINSLERWMHTETVTPGVSWL